MENLLPIVYNSARALVLRRGRILLLRKEDPDRGERFTLPGGTQEPGETLAETLERECLEEIGTTVEVGDLLHVADYFKPRNTLPPTVRHLVELVFDCKVPESYTPKVGHLPDKHQVEVIWAQLEQLESMPLVPRRLAPYLIRVAHRHGSIYLGRID